MRVLVVGAGGRLGSAIARGFAGWAEVTGTARADLDVRDRRAVVDLAGSIGPAAIVNCTAFNDVDGAEDDPGQALAVNAFAVRHLAEAARLCGAALVHFSTDFVFDGTADRPYVEEDRPNPLGVYAGSKLLGEWFAALAPRHYVLRVESLFGSAAGAHRPASVDRIVEAIAAGREARVFADRTVSPSYHDDVAEATRVLIQGGAPPGVYHCVNSGSCTWEALAREAGRLLEVEPRLAPILTADTPMRARRPRYCALSNAKLAAAGARMPAWQDALARHIARRQPARPAAS